MGIDRNPQRGGKCKKGGKSGNKVRCQGAIQRKTWILYGEAGRQGGKRGNYLKERCAEGGAW